MDCWCSRGDEPSPVEPVAPYLKMFAAVFHPAFEPAPVKEIV
jgi:hypothetical protein